MFSWRFYSGWALCLVLVMFRTAHDEAAERIDPTTPDSGTQRTDRYGDLLPKGAISRMGTSRFWADCYAVATVAFGSDSKKLLSLGQDRKIRCWDLATGEEVHTWDDSGEFIVSPDGKILVLRATEPNSNIARKVSMWDLATAKKLTEFESGSDRRLRALSPNGKTLFTLGALDQKIHLVRVPTAREFSHLGEESGAVSLAFSPDQRTLAAANKDNTITFWDVPTDKKIGQLPGHRVALLGVVFTADGQTLVS